jgi:hypothetical protein
VQNIVTVALFNLGNNTSNITVLFTEVGIDSSVNQVCVRDLWLQQDIGCISGEAFIAYSIPTHGSRLFRFDASGGSNRSREVRLTHCVYKTV